MKKILLPVLLAFVFACGSPDKQRIKEAENTTPAEEGYVTEEYEEPVKTTELPEDLNVEQVFRYENDSVRQELKFTLESGDDMNLLYTVQDTDLTCVLRYEGSASTVAGPPELKEQANQLSVDYPAKAYLFYDEICSFVVFLADDRSKAEVKPLECEEKYTTCPAWSVGGMERSENPS
jgi:hypothetical protein